MNIKYVTILVFAFFCPHLFSQVGINNTSPNATLDIEASNVATPSNQDGVLIPRIDEFPTLNPGAAQDGMLVFVTGNGTASEGFYYWDNATTSWVLVNGSGSDDDWREIGTTNAPDDINDNMYTFGKLNIGATTVPMATVAISNSNSDDRAAMLIDRELTTTSAGGSKYGLEVSMDVSALNGYIGIASSFLGSTISTPSYGFSSTANSATLNSSFNLYNGDFFGTSGTGTLKGLNLFFASNNTNSGDKYAADIYIDDMLPGIHYGIRSRVLSSTGYAGYFAGRVQLGESLSAGRYFLPGADGTAGQVITTDGTGTLSFQDPTTGAEKIDDLIDGKSDSDGTEDGSSIYLGIGTGTSDDSSDNRNVAIGFEAMNANTVGSLGVAIGYQALANAGTLSTHRSVAIGYQSLNANTTGIDNVGVGLWSLYTLGNGGYNTVLGARGMIGLNAGSNNVALGYQAGDGISSGDGNIFIGYNAGGGLTGTVNDRMYIDNSSTSSPLLYGEFDNNILRVNGELQVGLPAGTGYSLPSTDGTAGQVLTTDGSGTVSFSDVVGDTDWVTVGANIERQSGDVYIGDTALTNNNLYISGDILDWDSVLYFVDPSSLSQFSEIGIDAGSSVDPKLRFRLDSDTGMFSAAANAIGFTNGGTESMRIQSDGELSIGLSSATNYKLSVNSLLNTNQIRLGNDLFSDNVIDVNHGGQQGNSLDISVTNTYTLASRSGVSVFNEVGDVQTDLSRYETGTNNVYGLQVSIPTNTGGNEYGVYSIVPTAGYAGYFLGQVAIGTSSVNTYTLPLSRGVSGQIMQAGAGGAVSWTNPSSVFSITADNGLTETSGNIQLGGALNQPTSITQGGNSFDINLNGTGDFAIQDAGTDIFFVEDSGEVGIGTNTPVALLDVRELDNAATQGQRIIKTDNTSSITYGLYMEKTANGTGVSRGMNINMSGTGTGARYGMEVGFDGAGTAARYAFYSRFTGSATGIKRGLNNNFSNSGSGAMYGMYSNFTTATTSAQAGVYSVFQGTNGNYTGMYNEMSGASNNAAFGLRNDLSGTGTGAKTGVLNEFSGANGNGNIYVGIDNALNDTGNGDRWGVRNNMDGTGSGTQYGTWNDMTGIGAGNKYGTYNNIDSGAGGLHYGTFNQVDVTNGWAGYFLGRNYISDRLSIGELNNANASINVSGDSNGTYSHIELKETVANDGSRLRFTNSVETSNSWLLYGRADDTSADSRFNIFHTGTGNVMQIRGDGRVGINNNNPLYALELPNNTTNTVGRGRAFAWDTYSDSRIKKNQEELQYGLKEILRMTPKSYLQYASEFENGALVLKEGTESKQIGFIAQELNEIIPEATYQPKNENEDLWSVDYEKIIPVAVNAIKELNTKVENLEAENEQLKQQLEQYKSLEARISALEGNTNTNPSETANLTEEK